MSKWLRTADDVDFLGWLKKQPAPVQKKEVICPHCGRPSHDAYIHILDHVVGNMVHYTCGHPNCGKGFYI